jgi:hypothetical protein
MVLVLLTVDGHYHLMMGLMMMMMMMMMMKQRFCKAVIIASKT